MADESTINPELEIAHALFVDNWTAVNLKNFFSDLKRRNAYKVAFAYAVVGWLLIQIATQVFPFFEIPNWGVRLIVLIIVIGFPIALIIGWAFELTPEGIRRTEGSDDARTPSAKNRTWMYVVIIAGVLSIGLFFWDATPQQKRSWTTTPSSSLCSVKLTPNLVNAMKH